MDELRRRYPGAVTYRFGDSPGLCAALLALVRAGKKRATCSSEAEIAAGEAPPVVGRCDIAVDFENVPQLVTRTVELVPVRYCDMTEEMALMEGEDDSLESWRAGHERYYRRLGIFDTEMKLIWERFEVVEDLKETRI
ncbi:ASCH domain-containing protein [Mesobacterium sp. TK19101]|uniref:ASCH domain-containing protein n=1 Tax=Mesobacterium hydrothermale TaxID=3111907 RepID=A0ABU6HCM9_9RHOB|nr:ASCH domain-containing protein [Mesobacterium sp. TK19101]